MDSKYQNILDISKNTKDILNFQIYKIKKRI